jgi:hypothetical protein
MINKMKNQYVITFAFDGELGYMVQHSKPIPANDEQEACQILINQFENYEGIPCNIIGVNKI